MEDGQDARTSDQDARVRPCPTSSQLQRPDRSQLAPPSALEAGTRT